MDRAHRNVSFVEAFTLFFKNYFAFSGRSSRGAFWWYFLASLGIGIALGIVDGILGTAAMTGGFGIIGLLFSLATLIPGLALSIRRLHDTNRSGWWLLLALIPLIGTIVLIVFYCFPGTAGDNKYGADVEAGR